MKFRTPPALKAEHANLHRQLVRATKAGGRSGAAAIAVAKLMHRHFVKEEKYALPPLGALAALSRGKIGKGARKVLKLTDKLERELPRMLAEHRAIVKALRHLIRAAKADKKPEFAHFAEKLMAHARTEEQVSYPTALLVGRYLKIALAK